MEQEKLFYTMNKRDRKEHRKDKEDVDGGFHVDNRWADAEGAA